ncbi:MAG: inositol monophosphatase family protein [Candidatus Dormibacteraceae bacterium]
MLDVAVRAARAGAAVLREAGLREREAVAKGLPGDWVTAYDRASEEAILEVLARESPGVPVLAEESGGTWQPTMWAVDPLDGTTNFMRGLPFVGVSVGLLREGVPAVGCVIAPWLGLELAGAAGAGARIGDETLPMLGDVALGRAILATGAPFRHKERLPRYDPVAGGAQRRFEDLRRSGAAAVDLAWCATGQLDGYFELGLGTWDVAGGAAALLALGGRIVDWDGGDAWPRTGNLLAGRPAVVEALLELTRQAPER